MDEQAIVRAYHQRSKHALQRYAAGPETLDWDAQPDPWRRWDGAPLQPLPLLPALDDLPATTPTWAQLAQAGAVAPQPLDANAVGALLQLSLGLSAWKQQGPDRWAVRCNPSSGNLHPTEAWVLTRQVSGLTDGLHHYAPREHALAQRALLAPAGDSAAPGLWVALSSIHWREAWKYGERAFRYCQLDLGHALGALRLAAAVLGWRAVLRPLASADLAALLGLDRDADFGNAERESAECLLQLLPAQADASPAPPQAAQLHGWAGRANRLDRHPMYRWPLIDEVDAATRWPRPPAGTQVAVAAAPPPTPPTQHVGDASTWGDSSPGAIAVITRRRSAQRFDRRATLPLATLAALLAACKPGAAPPLDLWPQPPRVHLVVFAHRVDDLPSGAYLMPRGAGATLRLRPLLAPDADWTAVKGLPLLRLAENPALAGTLRTLCCHQALASDAVLAVAMLAEFDAALATDGAPAYRALLQEAGLLGHALYLQAEALGWRGTGIGCFFDDALHELLAVQGTALQSLYHFSIGAPVVDERVATTPPYAHLSQPAEPTAHATPPSLAQESTP